MDLGPIAQLGTASALLLAGVLIYLRKQVVQAADLGVDYLRELVRTKRAANRIRDARADAIEKSLKYGEHQAKLVGSVRHGAADVQGVLPAHRGDRAHRKRSS
jgi:hypothetical protein